MDIVIRAKKFKPYEIRQINYYRLYLQAITLSGTHLRPEIQQGDILLTSSTSRWKHFKQEKPNEVSWRTWRRACQLFSNKDGTLHKPLSDWSYSPDKLRQIWFSYYDSSAKTLFIHLQDRYYKHKSNLQDIYYLTNNSTNYLPPSSVPVT